MFKQNEKTEWIDISAYPTRTYYFPNGKLEVKDCRSISIHTSTLGGHAHRIITQAKGSHTKKSVYVPSGWIGIEWDVPKGVDAFVF